MKFIAILFLVFFGTLFHCKANSLKERTLVYLPDQSLPLSSEPVKPSDSYDRSKDRVKIVEFLTETNWVKENGLSLVKNLSLNFDKAVTFPEFDQLKEASNGDHFLISLIFYAESGEVRLGVDALSTQGDVRHNDENQSLAGVVQTRLTDISLFASDHDQRPYCDKDDQWLLGVVALNFSEVSEKDFQRLFAAAVDHLNKTDEKSIASKKHLEALTLAEQKAAAKQASYAEIAVELFKNHK